MGTQGTTLYGIYEPKGQGKMKRTIGIIGITVFHCIFLCISIYTIWGWLTLADIKKKALENNLSVEVVLDSLWAGAFHDVEFSTSSKNNKDSEANNSSEIRISMKAPAERRFLNRLNIQYCSVSSTGGYKEISFLVPFLCISDNVANFLFCFGIGYLISLLLVLVKMIKGKSSLTLNYAFLRPPLGALASSCLFLLVIAGGTLMWENVSNVKSLSLGAISIIGALYCEKLEKILSNSITAQADKE